MISVLLADDHALMRKGFRLILEAESDIEVTGEASDGAAAVSMASALRPDVVLMDVRMPGMDGIEATRLLRSADSGPRVLVLTTFDLDEYVYEALRAGASGFLLKDVPAPQLAAGIRTVGQGDALLAPSITPDSSPNSPRRAIRSPPDRALTSSPLANSKCSGSSRPE